MDIKSLKDTRYNQVDNIYEINTPSFTMNTNVDLYEYVVQQGEEMRIDLVMESIYDDKELFSDIDVLLYINDIDNPLNIIEGQIILFPKYVDLDKFRYYPSDSEVANNKIIDKISTPNKTTRVDKNRKEFVENSYSLPPVVLSESKPPVVIDSENIKIGGL